MALKDTIISDLKTIATDLGNPIMTWKSEEFEVIPSSTTKQLNLEMGGLGEDSALVLSIRKELFTDDIYPTSQEYLTYNSIRYRIQNVRHDPTWAFLRLFCIDDSRGV